MLACVDRDPFLLRKGMVDDSLSLGIIYMSSNCNDDRASVKAVKFKVEEHDMRIRQKDKATDNKIKKEESIN